MDIEWVNQKELATRLGVSPPYISKKIREGVLELNEFKKLDFKKSKIILNVKPKINTTDTTKKVDVVNTTDTKIKENDKIQVLPLDKAMQIIKSTQAQSDLIDLKIKQKKFIDKTKVEKEIFQAVRILRDGLLELGNRLKDELSTISDPHETKKIIDDEVIKNLENLAKRIKVE